jgi:predicted DNA-binding transcriptional regulator AlpA
VLRVQEPCQSGDAGELRPLAIDAKTLAQALEATSSPLVDARGVAAMLKVPVSTLYRMIAAEQFPSGGLMPGSRRFRDEKGVERGGSVRWRRADVLQWIDQHFGAGSGG